MGTQPDLAAVGAAIGDPARAKVLMALLDGRPASAGALARVASVAPSTASAHLARLVDARLVVVEAAGRRRMHRIAGPQVADALERLAALAPPQPVTGLRAVGQARAERHARSCYDHLAGEVGVALTDRLCELGVFEADGLALVTAGPLRALGIEDLPAGPRPMTRACLDYSERRPHLAGALGAAILDALLARDWVRRRPAGRALDVTDAGRVGLAASIGLSVEPVASSHRRRGGGRAATGSSAPA